MGVFAEVHNYSWYRISFCIYHNLDIWRNGGLERWRQLVWFPDPQSRHLANIYVQQTSRASLVSQLVKNLPAMQETWVWPLGWEDPLEKGKATHSSILAWRIAWTEEPSGLQSMVCKESATSEWLTLSNLAQQVLIAVWLLPTQPWTSHKRSIFLNICTKL